MKYNIAIQSKGDMMAALSAAITVAKALKIDYLTVESEHGFFVGVSQESRVVDVYKIYQLTLENKELKENRAKPKKK